MSQLLVLAYHVVETSRLWMAPSPGCLCGSEGLVPALVTLQAHKHQMSGERERCFVRAIVTTKWRVGPQSSLQANIQSKSESGPSFCHQAWRIEIITNRDRRNIEHLKAQLNSVILFLSPISFLASSTLPVVTESGSYSGWLYEKHYYSLWILISSHLDTERREGRELLE